MTEISIRRIFDATDDMKKSEVPQYLKQQNIDGVLRVILRNMFDEKEVWNLPEGMPPMDVLERDVGMNSYSGLFTTVRKYHLFKESQTPNVTEKKREAIFVGMLNVIHPDDYKVVEAMKTKKCPWNNINKSTVKKLYPELFE